MITEAQRRALFALREALHLLDEASMLIYSRSGSVRVCNSDEEGEQFGTTSHGIWLAPADVDRLLAEHPE